MIILYLAIPRKINFIQIGRYLDSCEQRFLQLYERGFDWIEFNTSLMWRALDRGLRNAIAIDARLYLKGREKDTLYREVLVGMRLGH